MITIYQLNSSSIGDDSLLLEMFANAKKFPKEADIIKALDYGFYQKAAEVDTTNLEEAYTKTNSQEQPWSLNEGVIQLGSQCTNTSVGDLAMLNGKLYFISGLGYTELPEETLEKLPKERILESAMKM